MPGGRRNARKQRPFEGRQNAQHNSDASLFVRYLSVHVLRERGRHGMLCGRAIGVRREKVGCR